MTKKLYALLLSCITLASAACGGSAPSAVTVTPEASFASDTPAPIEDKSYRVDYKSVMYNNMEVPNFAETDDSLYLLTNNILYFTDKEYREWLPLCARPDCKHNSFNCNAYVNSDSLILYDKYLYFLEGGGQQFDEEKPNYKVRLCRMGLDGSAHEAVFDVRENLEPEHSYKVAVSRWDLKSTGKYLIIRIVLGERRGTDGLIQHRFYYSVDLESLEAVPILAEYCSHPELGGFILYEGIDSHAYGEVCYYDDTPAKIVDIDLASGVTRELYEINETDRSLCYWYRCVGIIDGKLYFSMLDLPPVDEDGMQADYTGAELMHLYSVDLATGETELVVEEPAIYAKWRILDVEAGYWYNSIILKDNEMSGTYICDIDRNEIAFIPASEYPEEVGGSIVIGRITRDYIFAAASKNGIYDDNLIPVWYLDKADIGTDNLAWRKWEP